MGGLKYEDYKVTNPAAVQFDPARRMKELAALGLSNADALCAAPPIFTTPAPTITFDKTTVVGQIYWVPVGPGDNSPFEFMDVQFSNFAASNGFTSPHFGFRMIRQIVLDGSEGPFFQIQVQAGNPGLDNIPGLPAAVGFYVDLASKTASVIGTVPSSDLLRGAVLGVFVNAQSILSAAKFTVTTPAPAGKTLWSSAELISLAGQAEQWIAAGASTLVPVGAPYSCTVAASNGYTVCNGSGPIGEFSNMLLTWGGEYLGLRTQQSFNVLVSNLLAWAKANAPSVDPAYNASSPDSFRQGKEDIATPLSMLWPTLRDDPGLSPADRQTIENWIFNWISPPRVIPDYFPNDLGYWADEILMADAIRNSDNESFAFGVQRFYGALNQMRSDGSFPLAAQLSACSSVYSNTDLLHLTAIAEMAATQGYDLWSMSVNGKSLETAIEFLLNAYENPALLYQYSKAGGGTCFEGNPGDPPDFRLFTHPDSSLAWMEPYLARFPFSATAARLRAILGSNISAPPFPLMIQRAGLNTSCSFRTWFEFQPVSGVQLTKVGGDGQAVAPTQTTQIPLAVRVTDSSGKPLANTRVSFAVVQGSANVVAPAQILTDATGMAQANISMGAATGPVTVTASALGMPVSFSLTSAGAVPATVVSSISLVPLAFNDTTTLAPGAPASIYGTNLSSSAQSAGTNPLALSLNGVSVTFNGVPAPLYVVSPGLLDVQVPWEVSAGAAKVSVMQDGVATAAGIATIATISPSVWSVLIGHQSFGGVVNLGDGTFAWPTGIAPGAKLPQHPAKAGDILSVYATGLGPVNPASQDGQSSANGPSQTVVTTPTVLIGSIQAQVLGAVNIPEYIGLELINVVVPRGVSTGNVPIQIQSGAITSSNQVFIAISQ